MDLRHPVYEKDPSDVADYGRDWSDLLEADTISSSTWTVPAGLTKDSQTNDTTTTTVWLSGGTALEDYVCVNRIVTAGSRTFERSITIQVREL